jgi:hypothetical protein
MKVYQSFLFASIGKYKHKRYAVVEERMENDAAKNSGGR